MERALTRNRMALGSKLRGLRPTNAAQRILAESIAGDLGPRGVHVAYVVIDAVIDLECKRPIPIPAYPSNSSLSWRPVPASLRRIMEENYLCPAHTLLRSTR
jgi:hypothetical protein